jgi:hypothetical protein
VTTRFRSHVNPMHERFVQPTRANADVVVHGDRPLRDGLELVLRMVGSGQTSPIVGTGSGSLQRGAHMRLQCQRT